MYAIKVRPPTATAWFWLRFARKPSDARYLLAGDPYKYVGFYGITTHRDKARLLDHDGAAALMAELLDHGGHGDMMQVVRIGNGIHL